MPSILFIASHRFNRSPSQRYRFEQYFSFLESNGFTCELSYIIDADADKIFYESGNLFKKVSILFNSIKKRMNDAKRYNEFDIVFVQREALMIGISYFETKIKSSKAKFVFDFDDSIWLMDTSDANKKWQWLKNPNKTVKNIKSADLIFAGNNYLANYAKQFNSNVEVIPTTVDTDLFIPNHQLRNNEKTVIGWCGSITTIKHFEFAIPFLKEIKNIYGSKVKFVVIGDETYKNSDLEIQGINWFAEEEIATLNSFDIGIMPLPNDKWAKGKCGLKGLTYMALEIPTIMSAVGVNTEIINHGKNGFLASTTDEWVITISQLIDDVVLRKNIGEAARKTVVEKYSVVSQRENYLKFLQSIIK
jgi:glycosyltransferase involved in cell wall biosynthesis